MICINSCRGHGSHAQKSAAGHSERRASSTGRSLYHEPQPGFSSCLIVPHRAIRIILRPAQVRPVGKHERLARPVGGQKQIASEKKVPKALCLFLASLLLSFRLPILLSLRSTRSSNSLALPRTLTGTEPPSPFCCLRGSQIRTDWSRTGACLSSPRYTAETFPSKDPNV